MRAVLKWVGIAVAAILVLGMAIGSYQGHGAKNEVAELTTVVGTKAQKEDLSKTNLEIAKISGNLEIVAKKVNEHSADIIVLTATAAEHGTAIEQLKAAVTAQGSVINEHSTAIEKLVAATVNNGSEIERLKGQTANLARNSASYGWVKKEFVTRKDAELLAAKFVLKDVPMVVGSTVVAPVVAPAPVPCQNGCRVIIDQRDKP